LKHLVVARESSCNPRGDTPAGKCIETEGDDALFSTLAQASTLPPTRPEPWLSDDGGNAQLACERCVAAGGI
jgi:hypothetical protein